MLAISLIFVGITLVINGLYLAKVVNDKKIVIVLNFFTGGIILLFNLYQIISSTVPTELIGYFGGLLFGLTNLLVGFELSLSAGKVITGVYSGLASLCTITLGVYYLSSSIWLNGGAWLVWSLIWIFVFVDFTFESNFTKLNAIMLIFQGITTTLIFGVLQLLQVVVM